MFLDVSLNKIFFTHLTTQCEKDRIISFVDKYNLDPFFLYYVLKRTLQQFKVNYPNKCAFTTLNFAEKEQNQNYCFVIKNLI